MLAATGSVAAALEIVDSRIADWDISIVDTVADNASSGLFTLGPSAGRPADLDLAACPMRCGAADGGVHRIGRGLPRPPGHRGRLARRHRPVVRPAARAGEIVLSGALGPDGRRSRPGDRFTAEIGGLGRVTRRVR